MVILFRYCNTLQGGSSRGEKTGLKPPLTCGYTHCTLRGQPQEKIPLVVLVGFSITLSTPATVLEPLTFYLTILATGE